MKNVSPSLIGKIDGINEPFEINNPVAPYIMTIDIEEGKSEKLEIFFDSVPEKLAFDFCKINNLDFEAMQYLIGEINKLLNSKENIEINQNNNIQECIQEVDEDINSEINRYDEIDGKYDIKSDNKVDFDEYQNNKESSVSNNNNTTQFKNNSNKSICNLNNQSISSISKINNGKNNKNEIKSTKLNEDIKQFSYQLFLDISTTNNLKVSNKNNSKVKNSRNNNIFEKLYQDSKIRKISRRPLITHENKTSTETKTQKLYANTEGSHNKSEFINYGERLYIKGIKLKEKSKMKTEILKNDIDTKIKDKHTFKPQFIENIYDDNVDLLKVQILI